MKTGGMWGGKSLREVAHWTSGLNVVGGVGFSGFNSLNFVQSAISTVE
jgi:hypothetical protein